MSAFGIFALILTTAYIIYFAFVIFRDITASKKSPDAAANTESFDVSSFAQEESVEVKEINGGFTIGDNETSTETVSVPVDEPEAGAESHPNPQEAIKAATDRMDNSEEYVELEVAIPDTQFWGYMTTGNIDTSYMIDRKEVVADEPQKTSAGDAQPKDEI